MEEFSLNEQEFIELNKLLKLLAWVETGGEAKIRILQDEVLVNNEVENRIRRKLKAGDYVELFDYQVEIKK